MKITVNKSKFWCLTLFVIFLIISTLTRYILPERYFNDTKIIVIDRWKEIGWVGSYPFAIMFYKLTGMKYLPFFIIAMIQFPITTYILSKIGIPRNFQILNVKNVLMYIAFLLLAIYMSMPTKEFITFLMFSPIPFIFRSQKSPRFKIIISLLLFVACSFFRTYYLLIPIFAIAMYVASFIKFEKKAISTIFSGLMIVIFLSFSHGIIKGEFLSKLTREDYVVDNVNRLNINSAIQSPISQDSWYGEAFGIVYGFMAVNFPISEMIKHILSPQIVAFVIWELLFFYILFVRFSRCLKKAKATKLTIRIIAV